FGYNNNRFDGGGGADRLVMGGGNDTAIGGAGNDSLSGDGGKDKLIGGAGADALSGGASADRVIYALQTDSTATAAGRDTISDFRHTQGDRIDLSALDANLLTAGVNDSFTFRTAAQGFSGNGAEVTYGAISGGIKVLADTDANGTADFAVVLQGITGVVAGDFIL
ncbi:MAG: M10 family metallopeptidase C-terminal domain-containing protein, partial [Pseudorhodobacter sp.]|nr:M10 family metallopeptidase C-terminal domain-containing protein [Pseudorhodobacter sp.]